MNTTKSSAGGTGTSRGWRILRRLLITGAVLATLVGAVYTIENWRGKRAWEKCLREQQARGEITDWSTFIPAPVPDDQNIFKAPHMQEWFVKPSTLVVQNANLSAFALSPRPEVKLTIAEVKVVTSDTASDSQPSDAVLQIDDPTAKERVAALLTNALGTFVYGSRGSFLLAKPVDQIKPVQLTVRAKTALEAKQIAALFPEALLTGTLESYEKNGLLRFDSVGTNRFKVSLKDTTYGATDYLEWTQPLTADFDIVRKALERPFARIDCDYAQPYLISIPNFINIRNVTQISSQRAQCYLLLGQPEAAWHELELVHNLYRISLRSPRRETITVGKPITLVGAMINTAVHGVYTAVVKDGLRLHQWREPQLLAIERQLKENDLLEPFATAIKEERVATAHTFETMSIKELSKLATQFSSDGKSLEACLLVMPRGWLFQNMVVGSEGTRELLDAVDPAKQLVYPDRMEKFIQRMEFLSRHRSPYNFLMTIAMPNFTKALQVSARNQTLVNQAEVACALERYHLSKNEYPETFEALTPQFLAKLPHDVVGGQPLKYHRTGDNSYKIYSIGWDQKDDAGVVGKAMQEGDWVWEQGK